MKHLLEYDSYDEGSNLSEATIPVYDELKYIKNVNAKPEMNISDTQIISTVEELLSRVESGEIEKVSVIADIPSQGKNAPQYIRDLMAKERQRLGTKYSRYPEETPEGGRIEKRKTEAGDSFSEYTGEINVFVDSEFVVQGVIQEDNQGYVLAIPVSYIYRVKNNPSLMEYYTTKIHPRYVEEIHFTPFK